MKCPECGEEFKQKNSRQKYCFKDCTNRAKTRRNALIGDAYANSVLDYVEAKERKNIDLGWMNELKLKGGEL